MILLIAFLVGIALIFSGTWKNGEQWRFLKRLGKNQSGLVSAERNPLTVGQAVSLALESEGEIQSQVAFITGIEKGNLFLRTENNPTLRPESQEVRACRALQPGAKVTIEAAGQDALFRFSTLITQVTTGKSYAGERLLVLPLPSSFQKVQRRKHFRAPFVTPATFAVVPQDHPSADAIPVHGTLLDLSEGGFRADLGFALGVEEKEALLQSLQSGVFLRVRLPIALFTEPLWAKIVVAESGVQRGGLSVRVACEFLQMEGWQREFIASHLFQLQRERLKAS